MDEKTSEVLAARKLHVRFPVGRTWRRARQPEVEAVAGVDLALVRGATVGLVGPSACGKTTLVHCLLGLLPAIEGRVDYCGRDIATLGPAERRRFRRRVSAVFQEPASSLDPLMRLDQIVAEPLAVHQIGGRQSRLQLARALLRDFGLDSSFDARLPGEISGGEQQRVSMARALITEPELVMLDEPFASLDSVSRAISLRLLRRHREQHGVGYLLVSHSLEAVAQSCDQLVVMRDGAIIEAGRTTDLLTEPSHSYTRSLVNLSQTTHRASPLAAGE